MANTPTAPDVNAALDRFGETANRIADERNAYLAAGRAMLAALEAVQEWMDANNRRMPVVTNAIAAAKAVGIKAKAS